MNLEPRQSKTGCYCQWCGGFNEANSLRQKRWRCVRCLRAGLESPTRCGSSGCSGCSLPVPESGQFCTHCGVVLSKGPTPDDPSATPAFSSPSPELWPTKDWSRWGLPNEMGSIAPPCPRCGEKLRPDGTAEHGPHGGIGFCNPPWNAGWDGCCSACGHDLLIRIEQQTGFGTGREILVYPEERFHQTFVDAATIFAGLRIKVRETSFGGKRASESEVFLSMGELMELFKALEVPAKAFKAQMDWTCDWT